MWMFFPSDKTEKERKKESKRERKKENLFFPEKKKGGKAVIRVSKDNFHFYLSVFEV